MTARNRRSAVLAVVLGLGGAAAIGCGGGAPAETAPAMDAPAAQAPTAGDLLASGHSLEVPSFSLTDQTGAPFGSAQLDGHVWVANLTSTRCGDACQAVTAALRGIQDEFLGSEDVLLISFSVDPANDTPQVLAGHHRLGEDRAVRSPGQVDS